MLEQTIEIFNNSQKETNLFIALLLKIQAERDFTTYLIYGKDDDGVEMSLSNTLIRELQGYLLRPMLIMNRHIGNFIYEKLLLQLFNSEILALIFVDNSKMQEIIYQLAEELNGLLQQRFVFVLTQVNNARHSHIVREFFGICARYKMLNALVIFRDFTITHKLYSYTIFPTFQLEMRKFNADICEIFREKMRNLYGFELGVMLEEISPQYMFYANAAGELSSTGYVFKLLEFFGEKHNASLQYSTNDMLELNTSTSLEFFAANFSFDIWSTSNSLTATENMSSYSYPYEISASCLMVPMTLGVPYSLLFIRYVGLNRNIAILLFSLMLAVMLITSRRIFRSYLGQRTTVSYADILLNAHVIPGCFGISFQPYVQQTLTIRVIYSTIIFIGLLYGTFFVVDLKLFLNFSPFEINFVKTLADMQSAQLKILVSAQQFQELNFTYQQLLYKVTPLEEFLVQRSAFNTSYAYPVDSVSWDILQLQQSFCLQPSFRLTNICFRTFELKSFFLQSNSIYKEALSAFILRMQQMGFFMYWFKDTFYDLIDNGNQTLEECAVITEFHAWQVQDFHYVWLTTGGSLFVSILLFIAELITQRVKRKRKVRISRLENSKQRVRATYSHIRGFYESYN